MSKTEMLLHIYDILVKGGLINKKEMSEEFGVSDKTISRYIKEINMYFCENNINAKISYSKKRKGHVLINENDSNLNSKDILAISKVLLESRGFCKKEVNELINKLTSNCYGEDKKQIKLSIDNELDTYISPKHSSEVIDKLWTLNEAIKNQKLIEIAYKKIGANGKLQEEISKRILEPQGIIFSEFYFYLAAYMKGYDFEYPVIYRIDRIKKYKILGESFKVDYSERFKPGEFRNLIQFMHSGKLQNVVFKFKGGSIEAVLDRLPTAEVVKESNGVFTVRAKVFGSGIKMWILSQGAAIEVLEPVELREEIIKTISSMVNNYNS
ncbi:helix-turn-helix transcriptional regulator [Clostridium tunisiense]|uniref:helix-turn-helix transcriptional regulator n=1 Tax=Clostridium tunisiense TaxID=219748 RepID=UPI0003078E35|nr:WYL domain-containing protein [Clostridium tunisiense]